MRRLKLIAFTVILTLLLSTATSFACTGLYVGKDVSADGTTLIARSEDQGTGAYNKMYKVQPRITKAGRYYVDNGEDQNGFKVPLPKTTYKYSYVPDSSTAGDGEYPASCTNEYGLAVVGTISASPREEYEALDPFKEAGTGLREAILPGLIACQCKTAKGAVKKLAELVDTYGSEEGNILLFSDKKEAWIFEIYGGTTYAAMKMPTDKVAVFGNQFMIDLVDPQDNENFVFSANLFETIDKAGAVKEGDKYNLLRSISGDVRDEYSNQRTWIGHKILAPSTVGEYSDKELYPLFYSPDKKVSVLEVMDIYRNRYEGTDYDMMNEENYGRRPIGVTRQSDVHIMQTFEDLPNDTCQLQWLAMGNAEHSVFVPSFSGLTDTYSAYKIDGDYYNPKGMYWACKRICGITEQDRTFLSKGVKDYWKLQEKIMLASVMKEMDKVKSEYGKSKTKGRAYVTKLSKSYAKDIFTKSDKLFNEVLHVSINNVNDRTNNARKLNFVSDTRLTEAVKHLGYTVSKSNKTYIIKKGTTVYTLNIGSAEYTYKIDGKKIKGELSRAPYVYNGYVYVPMDFILNL